MIRVLSALIISATASLLAQDIQITKSPIEVKIKKNDLTLFNMPFEIKSKDNIDLYAAKGAVQMSIKDKSISITPSMLPFRMLVYGGDYPIYIEAKENKKKGAEKVFNFMSTIETNDKTFCTASLETDKRITDIAKSITGQGEINLPDFYKETVGRTFTEDELEITHKYRYKSNDVNADTYIVKNLSKDIVKLREVDMFSKDRSILANTFDNGNGILSSGYYTTVIVFRNPKIVSNKASR